MSALVQNPGVGASVDADLCELRDRVHIVQKLFDDSITGHAALNARPHARRLVGEIETRFAELFDSIAGEQKAPQ